MRHDANSPPPIDLLLSHAAFVRGMTRAVLHGDAEADDVVQDTWLVALSRGPRDETALRSWLGGVARRLARLSIRRRARARAREAARAGRDVGPDVAEVAAREEMRAHVVRALLALEEPSRTALLLRYYGDLPPRVIAERLGVPVETVKTRLKRGLARLRERLDPRNDEERRRRGAALLWLATSTRGPAAVSTSAALAVKVLAAAGFAASLLIGGVLLHEESRHEPPASADGGARSDVPREGAVLRGRGVAHAGNSDDAVASKPSTRVAYVGRVVDAAGRPVADAALVLHDGPMPQRMIGMSPIPWIRFLDASTDAHGGSTPSARTDAEGRFALAGRGVSHARLVIRHPDHAPRAVGGRLAARRDDGVLDFGTVSLGDGATVRVQALDDRGLPVEGATVVVQPPTGRDVDGLEREETVLSDRTGPDGRARFAGVHAGPMLVGALAENRTLAVEAVDLRPGASVDVRLTLGRGSRIRVVVLSRDGDRPVEGARVDVAGPPPEASPPSRAGEEVAREAESDDRIPQTLRSDRTGSDGAIDLEGLPAEGLRVTVVPPDQADVRNVFPPPFSVSQSARGGDTVVVRLAPAVTLDLQVSGSTADTARLRLLVHTSPDRRAGFDRTLGEPADLRFDLAAGTPRRLVGLRPGPWRLIAFLQDHRPRVGVPLVVGLPETNAPVRLDFEPARAIAQGRVADRQGPVRGARVTSYEWISDLGDGQRTETTTGDDGSFTLEPLLGEGFPLLLEVRAAGFVPLVLRVASEDRRDRLGELTLVRTGRIRGRATEATGAPLIGRPVLAWSEAKSPFEGKATPGSATTDAEGRFVFEDLAPGAWRLHAEGVPERTVAVAEGETVEVTLSP